MLLLRRGRFAWSLCWVFYYHPAESPDVETVGKDAAVPVDTQDALPVLAVDDRGQGDPDHPSDV